MSSTEDRTVASLLDERRGYVLRDLPERVAAVDEQLNLRGYDVTQLRTPTDRTVPPRGRRQSPRSRT